MQREDQYYNRNRETPLSSKNVNELNDRKFINPFNNDENNKNASYNNNNNYTASELSKKTSTPIKRVFNLLEQSANNPKYSQMLSTKEALSKKDSNNSKNISNLNQEEQPKNEKLNLNIINYNQSSIINVNTNNNPKYNLLYTDNGLKKNFTNARLNNNNSGNNNNERGRPYRNSSMEVNKNQFLNFNNSKVSNFNLNENSNARYDNNNYSLEKKKEIFKPSIPKNTISPNKQNIFSNNNKFAKNNFNIGINMSPLNGSLTIEKLNAPARNKLSNQSLNGINNLNLSLKAINNVNPFNLNNPKENKFSSSFKNIKDSEYSEVENKLPNKSIVNNISSENNNQFGNLNGLNEDNEKYSGEELFRRRRSVSNNDIINFIKNESADNHRMQQQAFQGNIISNKDNNENGKNPEDVGNVSYKNARGVPIKKPLINFSNFNNINSKPNLKKFVAEIPNKNKDFIDLEKITNNNNKSQSFFEKISKSSEKNLTNNPDISKKSKNSSNNIASEHPKLTKKSKRISQEKIKHNFTFNENNHNSKKNFQKEPKIIKKMCGRTKIGKYSDGTEKANNQDSFLIKSRILGNENFSIVGVFDGHGIQGHFISSLLKLFFSEYFSKGDLYKQDNKSLIAAVNNSIKSCFSDLNNVSNFANNTNYLHANSFTIGANSTRSNLKKASNNNITNYNNNFNNNIYNNNNNYNNYFNDASNFKNNSDKDRSILNNIFYEKLTEDNYMLIKNSFQLAEASFAQSKYDMNFSGSTCVCLFIIEDRIICGNCGDSRAILVASDKSNNNIIIPLSVDHKPELKDEANRIIKCNGRIEKRSENGIRTGPLRVWLKNENYPGLAMTRSIGDMVASKIGVTSEPEVIEKNISDDSKFIVVASDGLWEIFSNEEIAKIVSPYYVNMDVESAAEKLVDEAAKKWKREEKSQDDITAVIVFFQKTG